MAKKRNEPVLILLYKFCSGILVISSKNMIMKYFGLILLFFFISSCSSSKDSPTPKNPGNDTLNSDTIRIFQLEKNSFYESEEVKVSLVSGNITENSFRAFIGPERRTFSRKFPSDTIFTGRIPKDFSLGKYLFRINKYDFEDSIEVVLNPCLYSFSVGSDSIGNDHCTDFFAFDYARVKNLQIDLEYRYNTTNGGPEFLFHELMGTLSFQEFEVGNSSGSIKLTNRFFNFGFGDTVWELGFEQSLWLRYIPECGIRLYMYQESMNPDLIWGSYLIPNTDSIFKSCPNIVL